MASAFDPILEPFIEAVDDAFIRYLTTTAPPVDVESSTRPDDVLVIHRGYTQSQVNVTDWSTPETTDAEVRWRIHLLRRAGHLIHEGRVPEPGWTAAQLWDLADVLAADLEGGADG